MTWIKAMIIRTIMPKQENQNDPVKHITTFSCLKQMMEAHSVEMHKRTLHDLFMI